MNTDEFQECAYDMETAYKKYRSIPEMVKAVAESHPDVNADVIAGMAWAIDAYVDIND